MNPNDPTNMSLEQISKSNGELANGLAYSGDYHRRLARRAANKREAWVASGSDRLMTFTDFRQQGRRNKIRRDLGLNPIYLAGEGEPNTVH